MVSRVRHFNPLTDIYIILRLNPYAGVPQESSHFVDSEEEVVKEQRSGLENGLTFERATK